MKFEQKVLQFIEKFHMLHEGTGVIVGLSGGADSVALLEVLCCLRENLKLRISAVHVHHGIRAAAQSDADFCKQLCFEKNVDFYLEYADVPGLAETEGLSLEEAGRKARYHLFEIYRQKLNMDVIAVAHHQNDQAETMLFQLFRGSGIRGLSAMSPKNERMIRPLLAVSREEIEDYLQEKNLAYVVDETNDSDDYSRNRIRHHLIPEAEALCPGAVLRMNQTAGQLREITEYLELQAADFLHKYSHQSEKGLCISAEELLQIHPALQKMVISEAVERAFQSRKNFTEKHILGILDLLDKAGEKTIHLPGGNEVVKCYQDIILQHRETDCSEDKFESLQIEPDGIYFLKDGTILETKLFLSNNLENIPKSDCTKWFDYDKISSPLFLRKRKQGDYLTVRDDGARKSLQDYLVNEKVPKSERDALPVLADGQHVVWVPGKRISAYYKVTEQTKNILQIHIGGKQNG